MGERMWPHLPRGKLRGAGRIFEGMRKKVKKEEEEEEERPSTANRAPPLSQIMNGFAPGRPVSADSDC